MEKILTVENAVVKYEKKEVLRGLTLGVKAGEIAAVIGPNGAGKSTLLRVITGILQPSVGAVYFENQNITNWTTAERAIKGIGYVMQGGRVFTGLTVIENLEIAGSNLPETEISQRTEETLEILPLLSELSGRRAGLLSGGERQLLSIAMQLIRRPKILLLDEPSAGLAPRMIDTVFGLLTELNQKSKMTILLVEQNIKSALEIADQAFSVVEGKVTNFSTEPREWLVAERLEQLFLNKNLSKTSIAVR